MTAAKERIRWLSLRLAQTIEALELALPENLSTANPNIPDSTVVSIDATMGDLRVIAAALKAAKGEPR